MTYSTMKDNVVQYFNTSTTAELMNEYALVMQHVGAYARWEDMPTHVTATFAGVDELLEARMIKSGE